MDEQTTLGSEESGNPGDVTGDGDQGSNTEASAFLDALSEDNRQLAESRKLDSPEKIFKSYRELQSKLGETLNVPGDDADNDAWDKFYARIGRPEDAKGYEFKMPEGLAENFPYDQDSAGMFAEWAHGAGLSPRQAQKVHDNFVTARNAEFIAGSEASDAAATEAHKLITKEWGEPNSDLYKRNSELANRAIRELGGEALEKSFKANGLFNESGSVKDAAIAFAMAKVGQDLYSEDTVYSGEARTRNPFDPKIENLTEQGRVLREDPELAKNLIRAVNREKDFTAIMGS